MKFGKDFKKRMVPEWTDAYMDYQGLKRLLQNIRKFRQSNQPPTPVRALQKRLHLYRTFSGLISQDGNLHRKGDIEDQVISVKTTQQEDSRKLYKTKFLMSYEEGGEKEAVFFQKLDHELNKVNSFYKNKVDEVMKEAAILNKQMDALVALRIKVMNPDFSTDDSDVATTTQSMIGRDKNVDNSTMGTIQEVEDNCTYYAEIGEVTIQDPNSEGVDEESTNQDKQDPLSILNHVKLNNTLESPLSTIKGVFMDSKDKDLSFKKEELRKIEDRFKLVFTEMYRRLHLLKHYSFMNLSAFSKIMKKYEKITSRHAARSYMKIVEDSFIGSSDEVAALLESVETTFIKQFSNSNRRKGMKLLRPKRKREKHSITFFSGFFSGCSIALLVAVVLLFESGKLFDKEGTSYMEKILPLYSLYAYITLHMLLYAANVYFWKRYRVNYPFIFGFKQGTELSYREVFLLSTGLAVLALATSLAHLHLKMDSRIKHYEKIIEMIPLGLFIVVLLLTFWPFNILYRSSRFFLINCLFRCISSPLYEVTLPDFFLADQLTSQIQALRCFEFYICYYGFGEFTERKNKKCFNHGAYNVFYFIIAVIPYWIRFLQCLRRLIQEKDVVHVYNGLRYFLTIVAVLIRTAFELRKGTNWKVLAVVSSVLATVANTYWDIVMDWGLLQRKSKNIFLRDKLVVSHKSVYFAAMVLDVSLRFAWLQLVLKFKLRSLQGKLASAFVACLEILRRGMWNFFRLENEHLNNVGKYRAFKSVPLPFNYYDDDDNLDKDG